MSLLLLFRSTVITPGTPVVTLRAPRKAISAKSGSLLKLRAKAKKLFKV